jgi:hypothetical protein
MTQITLGTVVADFETSLATAMAVGATSATLLAADDDDFNEIPPGRYFLTIDGNNSQKEHISCDLNAEALTNIKTLSRQGVEVAGCVRPHRVGAKVVLTDFAHIKKINDLLDGTTDFDPSIVLAYSGTANITSDHQLATKLYVDTGVLQGAADASKTTKGIAFMSTGPASATGPIAVGDNDTRIPTQDENDALVGSSGTASSSNKYVTEIDVSSTATADKIVRLTGPQYPAADGSEITGAQLFTIFPRGETVNGATTPVPVVLIDDTFQEEYLASDCNFGKVTTGNKAAIGFTLQSSITLTTLKVWLKKVAAPTDNVVFTIQTENAGVPSGTPVTNGTSNNIAGTGLSTSYIETTVTFASTVTLAANTQYWLVAYRDSTTSDTNYYAINGVANTQIYASFTGGTFDASSWATNTSLPYMQLIPATGSSMSVWRADTNHANYHMRFAVGVVNTDGAKASSAKVILRGVLSGFTGLTPNTIYYAQDTIGTIGATAGTTESIVGTALSPTTMAIGIGTERPQLVLSQSIGFTTTGTVNTIDQIANKHAKYGVGSFSVTNASATVEHELTVYKVGRTSASFTDTAYVPNGNITGTLSWAGNVITATNGGSNPTASSGGTIYIYR